MQRDAFSLRWRGLPWRNDLSRCRLNLICEDDRPFLLKGEWHLLYISGSGAEDRSFFSCSLFTNNCFYDIRLLACLVHFPPYVCFWLYFAPPASIFV